MATITTIDNGDSGAVVRGAINDNFTDVNAELEADTTAIGTLASLTTTEKTNLVGAVNEVNAKNKRSERIIVGTTTSSWSANNCDFLCDGTADDVQINAAIGACSSGGEIVILDGTYSITAPIVVNKNLKIRGSGTSTILTRAYVSGASSGMIYASAPSCYKLEITGLSFYGVGNTYTSTVNNAIYAYDITSLSVYNNYFYYNAGYGIYYYTPSNEESSVFNIDNNVFNSGYFDIFIDNAQRGIISNNIISDTTRAISFNNTTNLTITSNVIKTCEYGIITSTTTYATIINNVINNSSTAGIYLNACSYFTVASNNVKSLGGGLSIRLNGTGNNYNFITGNSVPFYDVTSGGGTSNTFAGLNKYN